MSKNGIIVLVCVVFASMASTVFAADLRLHGSCPGPIFLEWSNATPNAQAGVIYAHVEGSFVIRGGPCAGTELRLGREQLQLVRTFNTGPNGSGMMQSIGPVPCRGYVQIIIADSKPCSTSNVVPIPR
jgi:hypothetical protein